MPCAFNHYEIVKGKKGKQKIETKLNKKKDIKNRSKRCRLCVQNLVVNQDVSWIWLYNQVCKSCPYLCLQLVKEYLIYWAKCNAVDILQLGFLFLLVLLPRSATSNPLKPAFIPEKKTCNEEHACVIEINFNHYFPFKVKTVNLTDNIYNSIQ